MLVDPRKYLIPYIERLAYEIWEQEGRPHGRDQEHWQIAETSINEIMRKQLEDAKKPRKRPSPEPKFKKEFERTLTRKEIKAKRIAHAIAKLPQGTCFWCGVTGPTNRDHVVPRGVGGGMYDNANIVRSCPPCNTERGLIVAFHAAIKDVKRDKLLMKPKTFQLRMKALNKEHPSIVQLQAKWETIEVTKLGYSPSAEISIDINWIFVEENKSPLAYVPQAQSA